MIVSKVHRFVFIQTPKTGSTSMKHVLQKYQEYPRIARHATLPQVLAKYPELRGYYAFGVNRDVADWQYSCYRWARRKQDHPAAHKGMTFDEYRTSGYYPNWYHRDGLAAWLPAWQDCVPAHWLKGADQTLQFESLAEEWPRLLDRLGLPYEPLPHMNRDKNK